MSAQLLCQGLVKRLGGKPILNSLDLDVRSGEIVSLLGASGSGKTTLLRCIAGLADPDAGSIILGHDAIFSQSATMPPEKRRIGMVFQDYALWPHMSVRKNLSFGLKAQRMPEAVINRQVDHALELARLTALSGRFPSELSGGQQQRVAIARCLAARPALMLFDEPLSNLDAALREDVRTEMVTLLREQKSTVVYVTHDQEEAMAVSDRIAVMRGGTIAQFSTPQQIYDRPANRFVAGFIGGFSTLSGLGSLDEFNIEGLAKPLRFSNPEAASGFLVIRPEDARPEECYDTCQIPGTVTGLAFRGRNWRITLSVAGNQIKIDWPQAVAVGESLTFSLPPERCIIVQDDDNPSLTSSKSS